MGKYLSVPEEEEKSFLQREGTVIPKKDVERFMWSPVTWLVCQVEGYTHKPAIVCYHERELAYIKRTLAAETRDITYYLILAKKLKGKYE